MMAAQCFRAMFEFGDMRHMQALKGWLSCKQGCEASSQGWSSGSGWLCADRLSAVLMTWESWEAADRARTALLLVSDDRLQMSMEEDQMDVLDPSSSASPLRPKKRAQKMGREWGACD